MLHRPSLHAQTTAKRQSNTVTPSKCNKLCKCTCKAELRHCVEAAVLGGGLVRFAFRVVRGIPSQVGAGALACAGEHWVSASCGIEFVAAVSASHSVAARFNMEHSHVIGYHRQLCLILAWDSNG